MAIVDEIRFLQNHLPGPTPGEYEITVEQKVRTKSAKIAEKNQFSTTRKFSVRGDRFTLKPADVQAVFPPAGSLGDHADVLPHILLTRSTLPWERDAGVAGIPWLALLLFHEGEAPQPKIVSLEKLPADSAKFPSFNRERGQGKDDPVTVIDVPLQLLEGILPDKDELSILTHVRAVTDYVFTDQAAAGLRSEGVPEDVLTKLAGIKGQQFVEAEEFLAALKATLGDQQAAKYEDKIAKHCADHTELAVIIGNRLPKSKGMSTAHLVSLEGRYNANGFDKQGAGEKDLIRLVSLWSWSFACLDHQQSFSGLLTHLNHTPHSTLRLPDVGAKAANPYLASGAVPLWHGLRQGGRTVSWYHGPLGPAKNLLTDHGPSAPDLPVRAADELIRYDPAAGMFDVSYAAAWELGRLLALQSKSFSVSLYNWKRAHAQHVRQSEERLIHASPLDVGLKTKARAVAIPAEVSDWFRRRSLLEGVPFNYLVPDERLLPLESIRFFWLDWLWVECLLDGAFSIGRATSADHRHDKARKTKLTANPHGAVTGMLLRSDVVAGWPGLLVDAFDDDKKLTLLRADRLSANVLLCLFGGEAAKVEIHQRPEMLHFGLDEDTEKKTLHKKLRDDPGDVSPIPLRQATRVLKISELASKMKAITSERFACQMIENVEKVRFKRLP
jgi:hypothetical protein